MGSLKDSNNGLIQPLLDFLATMTTPVQIMLAIIVLAFFAVLFVRARLLQWTFSIFGGLVLVALSVYVFINPDSINGLVQQQDVWVRILPQNVNDPEADIKTAKVVIPLKTEPRHTEVLNAQGIVNRTFRPDELPLDLDNWIVTVSAEGFKPGKAKLLLVKDGAYQTSIDLTPLEIVNAAPSVTPSASTDGPPDQGQNTPPRQVSQDDVRSWKVTFFGCVEHAAKSMPLAQKLADAFEKKGYQRVGARPWPPAGSQSDAGYYYALTSELTLNYTDLKAPQADQLRHDLRSVPNLPPIEDKLVDTEFARSLTVVVCPGFTQKDWFQ